MKAGPQPRMVFTGAALASDDLPLWGASIGPTCSSARNGSAIFRCVPLRALAFSYLTHAFPQTVYQKDRHDSVRFMLTCVQALKSYSRIGVRVLCRRRSRRSDPRDGTSRRQLDWPIGATCWQTFDGVKTLDPVRLSAKNKSATFHKSTEIAQREQRTKLDQSIRREPKYLSLN